jgi:RNase E specificity factor CsrD
LNQGEDKMRNPMTTLKQKALFLMVGLLLLNGVAIYLLQTQQLQESNQHIAALLQTELASPEITEQQLVAVQKRLRLDSLAIYEQSSQRNLLQTSVFTEGLLDRLYPGLKGEVALPLPGQKAIYHLQHAQLLPALALQSTLALLTIILAVISMLILQNKLFHKINTGLLEDIQEPNQTPSPLMPEVSEALHTMRHQLESQLAGAEQRAMELELRVNQDPLTGLLNRSSFRQDLTEILNDEEQASFSLVAVIRATELDTINQQRGYVMGDKYLLDVANLITKSAKKLANARIYRLAGSDFAVLLKVGNSNQATVLGNELKMLFDQYQQENDLESVAYSGLTLLRPGQEPDQILSRSDLALAKAQTNVTNGWYFQEKDSESYLQGESHWKQVIADVIARKAILLMQQPIQSMNISIRSYTEIFARFVGENEQIMPTETLLAMAQRHDLLIRLEQQIIELIMQKYLLQNNVNQRWGINLSANALMNNAFLIWLERQLLRDSNVAANLVFEVNEDLLDCNLAASIRLFEMLRRVGSRSSISKFGKGLGSFRLYRELKPDYIKLDPSLINVLERDNTSQQFIRMIVEVSHRLGCVVIAEGVENIAQKQLLETMYIDAIQGYLIARPTPLSQGYSIETKA